MLILHTSDLLQIRFEYYVKITHVKQPQGIAFSARLPNLPSKDFQPVFLSDKKKCQHFLILRGIRNCEPTSTRQVNQVKRVISFEDTPKDNNDSHYMTLFCATIKASRLSEKLLQRHLVNFQYTFRRFLVSLVVANATKRFSLVIFYGDEITTEMHLAK